MKSVFWLAMLVAGITHAAGDVQVKDPWVRATVPGQMVAGAYLEIVSPTPARLVGAASPLAKSAEIHSMKMDGDVMRMSAVPAIELPAGQGVKLAPGGYHIMLMGLARQLKPGDKVPLTLKLEGGTAAPRTLAVEATVREGR